jgi:Phosphate/sulphate permeases
MHDTVFMLVVTVVVLALLFDCINGCHDAANAIATSVTTRAISPQKAILMAASLNFLGALVSTGVAKTVGGDLIRADMINQVVIIAALVSAISWNMLTWKFGIPSSSSHTLFGGLIGAAFMHQGIEALVFSGIAKIVASLVLSPLIALFGGTLVMIILLWLFRAMSPSFLNEKFKKAQIVSAAMMSFSHGANDAQKAMGIMTLALLSGGLIPDMEVPLWVKISAATAMGLGTAMGGWRIIRTMGGKIFKLEPISGFAADLNSSLVIFGATLLHMPVSTTHVVSGSIMGVGVAKRVKAVRWSTAQQMLMAWVLTMPISAIVGAVCYQIITYFL